MYVVTFYSFKGGVGRTMALLNVAYDLARTGRRVLIIDFDLEAPGIATYSEFSAGATKPGIVDYVSSFVETKEAPSIGDFISSCNVNGTPIWFIGAGMQGDGASYSLRLAGIDWQTLYRERHGYLLFEDLKQQLRTFDGGFDYVLIDSRTGHTDVSGICTRQLPNAVVLMFFPTPQNIIGLAPIAKAIRREKRGAESLTLHFCPSNIPAVDDAEQILKSRLGHAASQLGYQEPAAVIHHYSSLDFVRQSILSAEKPASRLAEEYRQLSRSIAQRNVNDRLGAIAFLQSLRSKRDEDGIRSLWETTGDLLGTLDTIKAAHAQDGEVHFHLAPFYRLIGDSEREAEALTVSIRDDSNTSDEAGSRRDVRRVESLMQRAQLAARRRDVAAAMADLKRVLASPRVAPVTFIGAINSWRSLDPKGFSTHVMRAPALSRYSALHLRDIASALQVSRDGARVAADILAPIVEAPKRDPRASEGDNAFVLGLIGSQQFERALRFLDRHGKSDELADAFNHAVALWGDTGRPAEGWFERFIELGREAKKPSANYHQCVALACCVLGWHEAALSALQEARRSAIGGIFSCWRYLHVTQAEFLHDVEMIERSLDSNHPPEPYFLQGEETDGA